MSINLSIKACTSPVNGSSRVNITSLDILYNVHRLCDAPGQYIAYSL